MGKRNLTEKEIEVVKKAALIAALSSNHSWKTHKYLSELSEMDKEGVSNEFQEALKDGWKKITESDVDEVIHNSYKQHLVDMWFYYAVEDSHRNEYTNRFNGMKKELERSLEPIEKQV